MLEASRAERSSTAPPASSPHTNPYRSSVQFQSPLAPPTRTGYSTGAIEPIEEDEETRGFSTGAEEPMMLDNPSDDGDASDDGDGDNSNGDIITTSGTQKGRQQATPGPDGGYIQGKKRERSQLERSQLIPHHGGVV